MPTFVVVVFVRRAKAGLYAEGRYRSGLKSYRRRMQAPLLVLAVPLCVFILAIAFMHRLDAWSLVGGAAMATAVVFATFVRDDAPQHVVNWRRGAEGERRTERALRALERKGWSVEHDIQREGQANFDHIVRGPRGVFS